MRKSSKYALGTFAILCVVAAGAIAPGELAKGRDSLILGQVHSEPLDATELSDYVNISIVDKVSLLSQASGIAEVYLQTGAMYDQDTVRARFLGELDKLHELGLYPLSADAQWNNFRTAVRLYIQNDEPAINMIVWEITMQAELLSGIFYLDDQTGKILSFSFSGAGFDDLVYQEDLVREWADYLGTDVRNIRKSAQPDEPGHGLDESVFLFELYSVSRSVSGQIACAVGGGAERANRWSLGYIRIHSDQIQG